MGSRHENHLTDFNYTCIHKDKQTLSCIVGWIIFAIYLETKWEDEYFPRYFTESFHSGFIIGLKY